jgi:hypothetical protein
MQGKDDLISRYQNAGYNNNSKGKGKGKGKVVPLQA